MLAAISLANGLKLRYPASRQHALRSRVRRAPILLKKLHGGATQQSLHDRAIQQKSVRCRARRPTMSPSVRRQKLGVRRQAERHSRRNLHVVECGRRTVLDRRQPRQNRSKDGRIRRCGLRPLCSRRVNSRRARRSASIRIGSGNSKRLRGRLNAALKSVLPRSEANPQNRINPQNRTNPGTTSRQKDLTTTETDKFLQNF